jgi:hypothetical protein
MLRSNLFLNFYIYLVLHVLHCFVCRHNFVATYLLIFQYYQQSLQFYNVYLNELLSSHRYKWTNYNWMFNDCFHFQINSKKPVRMAFRRGYEEETFLKRMEVEPNDLEFLADNCTKVRIVYLLVLFWKLQKNQNAKMFSNLRTCWKVATRKLSSPPKKPHEILNYLVSLLC